jgi:O-antigen/teichoic acid export membrane protein
MGKGLNATRDLSSVAVYRRLARNSAYLAGGTVASATFMMLATVLNARALDGREFGLLVLFQSATMMVTTLMSFSTQQPVIKLGSTALADGDLERLGRIIGLGLMLDLFAALVASVAAFALLALGGNFLGIGDERMADAAVFAGSLLFTGYLTSNGIFRLLDRFGLLSLIQAGCALAIFAASAYLYASHAPFGAFCWAWSIGYALIGQVPLVVGLFLARQSGIRIALSTTKMQPGEVRTFLAYCWTTWGIATAEALRSNGDSLLVGSIISVEGAGIYNVAKQLAGVFRKANTVYASAMFPEISAISAHGEAGSALRVRQRVLWISGLIGGGAIVAAVLLGRLVLVELFGTGFDAAYLPLVILTAAAAFQLISYTLSMYVQVYLGPQRLFVAHMIAVGVFLVAIAPLTSAFGLRGTSAAQVVFSIALIYLCSSALRRMPLSPVRRDVPTGSPAGEDINRTLLEGKHE